MLDKRNQMWSTLDMSDRDYTDARTLREFAERCGGQKAASVRLECSPQFIGQIIHGLRSMPEAMKLKLKGRAK
jgi:hypothetical protein